MQWDTSGIAVFFFPRGSIPADIQAEAPQPSTWGLAMSRWPAIDCDPFKFFYDHVAIFDTTLWYVPLFIDGREQYSASFASAVATGLPAYGRRLGYPAKIRAVLLELASLHVKISFATTDRPSKKLVSIHLYPGGFHAWLIHNRLIQTGKSYRTSDTRRTRHDIHAPVAFSRSSHPRRYFQLSPDARSLSHYYRLSQRRHEVQTAVFTSPYPLLRVPISL